LRHRWAELGRISGHRKEYIWVEQLSERGFSVNRKARTEAAAANGRVYSIGALSAGYLNTVEEYDPGILFYTRRTELPPR
jgi:hypothetical protein